MLCQDRNAAVVFFAWRKILEKFSGGQYCEFKNIVLIDLTSYTHTLIIFLFAATGPGGQLLLKAVGSNASTWLIDSGLLTLEMYFPGRVL